MRPDVVFVVSPERQFAAGLVLHIEDLLIQQLISQAAIEAFDEAILLRFAWVDVMPVSVVTPSPSQDCATGELCSVTPSEWCWLGGYDRLRSPQIAQQVVIASPQVPTVAFATNHTAKQTDYDRDCYCTRCTSLSGHRHRPSICGAASCSRL